MPQIAKLVCNRLGWTVPSGLDAKSDNAEYGPFEARFHFGFEEWLFNEHHTIELQDGKYYFGFLECFRNNRNFNTIDCLHLFTQLYSNELNINQVNTKRYIGYLTSVEPISDRIYNQIIQEHPGIVDRMREELKDALINDPILPLAIEEFNVAIVKRELFNCLYFRRNRHNTPPNRKNWEYLHIPQGPQQHLSNSFKIKDINFDNIQQLQNNQHIPQVP
jgi:hypothetical protein